MVRRGGDKHLRLQRYDEAPKTWMAPKFIAALAGRRQQ